MEFFFEFDFAIPVAFDVSFQDGVVVSETHFPIMNDVIVDNVNFVWVVFHNDLKAIFNHRCPFFIDELFHFGGLIVPVCLVIFVPVDVSALLGGFDLFMFGEFGQDGLSIDGCVGHFGKVKCSLLQSILWLF